MKNEINLRAPEPDDVDRLYAWENDAEGGLHGHWAHAPLSRFQIWEYVDTYSADPAAQGGVRMIAERSGEAIGTADLYDLDLYNRRAWVGIYIARDKRGGGAATEVLQLLMDYAFNRLGLHALYATCLVENVAACRLFESAGFAQCGIMPDFALVDGRFRDAALLVMRR